MVNGKIFIFILHWPDWSAKFILHWPDWSAKFILHRQD